MQANPVNPNTIRSRRHRERKAAAALAQAVAKPAVIPAASVNPVATSAKVVMTPAERQRRCRERKAAKEAEEAEVLRAAVEAAEAEQRKIDANAARAAEELAKAEARKAETERAQAMLDDAEENARLLEEKLMAGRMSNAEKQRRYRERKAAREVVFAEKAEEAAEVAIKGLSSDALPDAPFADRFASAGLAENVDPDAIYALMREMWTGGHYRTFTWTGKNMEVFINLAILSGRFEYQNALCDGKIALYREGRQAVLGDSPDSIDASIYRTLLLSIAAKKRNKVAAIARECDERQEHNLDRSAIYRQRCLNEDGESMNNWAPQTDRDAPSHGNGFDGWTNQRFADYVDEQCADAEFEAMLSEKRFAGNGF